MGTGKFLFVIPTLSNGGAERVISVLSSAITRNNHEAWIVKYYTTENEYPTDKSVHVENLSGGHLSDYAKISYFEKIKRLRRIIEDVKPDYVLPFMFQVALCTTIAAWNTGTSVIQSIRINPAMGPRAKWKRIIRDHLVYRSKCTFVQNQSQKDYFRASHHDRIHVLFNPVSEELLDTEWAPERERFIVCGVGRLEEQKNFRQLMDAFKIAFSDVPEAILRIYGEGSLSAELQSHADSLGMNGRIQMMGRSNEMKSVYQSASLYVLSSDYEGMPNALIEAMAVGVPCVSTDCPTGPADLIADGENGSLVPVNDKEAMAAAMRQMYEKRNECDAMSAAAKDTIRRLCSPEQIARKLIEVCEKI